MGEVDESVKGVFADLQRGREALLDQQHLRGGGGGGTSGGVSDDWKASVDRQLGQLHGDVRALLNRGVAAVVALAVLIGGLYLYTNAKFDTVAQSLTAVQVQQARMDAKLDILLERTAPAKR